VIRIFVPAHFFARPRPRIFSMTIFEPATRPTMYFIGVTTGQSSIMKVFPAWAEHLGFDGTIKGIDFPLDDRAENYLAAVEFIKNDPCRWERW